MHRSINAELQWLQDCIIEHGEYDVKTNLFDLLIGHCNDDGGKRTQFWRKWCPGDRVTLHRSHTNGSFASPPLNPVISRDRGHAWVTPSAP